MKAKCIPVAISRIILQLIHAMEINYIPAAISLITPQRSFATRAAKLELNAAPERIFMIQIYTNASRVSTPMEYT
jgi:hypothetical protein